ncbi:Oxoglutarate/iron-dependent dioxygenase [Arabidopsis thaliana x Arabidopsis arenosa]|uniref:Oxoglutarate/iron-dependent dioxygenase n=1 Tax=Arabidopsis thaliana x Arabidopsis arenosa TaxID=1240361 RepID=A0A8T1Z3W4_9BRAS|nr:Oxoglutarate/iron-dependent dioxygenase [Arabidopsis thaliana x Arabidopsis arenosa]
MWYLEIAGGCVVVALTTIMHHEKSAKNVGNLRKYQHCQHLQSLELLFKLISTTSPVDLSQSINLVLYSHSRTLQTRLRFLKNGGAVTGFADCKKCNETAPLAPGTKRLASEALAHEWDSKRLNQGYTSMQPNSAIYASFPGMSPGRISNWQLPLPFLQQHYLEREQNNGVMETGCAQIARTTIMHLDQSAIEHCSNTDKVDGKGKAGLESEVASYNVDDNYGGKTTRDLKKGEDCDNHSVGSWKETDIVFGSFAEASSSVLPSRPAAAESASSRTSWADMAQEDDKEEEERDSGRKVEQKRIVNQVYQLQDKGRKGELREHTFNAPRKWMRGKGRVTIQFGCCYNYAIDRAGNPPGILQREEVVPLPPLFKDIIRRLIKWHVLPPTCVPDSCIVNIYDEGDCIPPHIDNHDFLRPFCTISFLSECDILFGSNMKIEGPGEFSGSYSIPLPVGSVLVLNGNGADVAKHCVPAVPTKRISITFRKMDESKRPIWFTLEPNLQGIEPLPLELNRSGSAAKSSGSNNHNGTKWTSRRRQQL